MRRMTTAKILEACEFWYLENLHLRHLVLLLRNTVGWVYFCKNRASYCRWINRRRSRRRIQFIWRNVHQVFCLLSKSVDTVCQSFPSTSLARTTLVTSQVSLWQFIHALAVFFCDFSSSHDWAQHLVRASFESLRCLQNSTGCRQIATDLRGNRTIL